MEYITPKVLASRISLDSRYPAEVIRMGIPPGEFTITDINTLLGRLGENVVFKDTVPSSLSLVRTALSASVGLAEPPKVLQGPQVANPNMKTTKREDQPSTAVTKEVSTSFAGGERDRNKVSGMQTTGPALIKNPDSEKLPTGYSFNMPPISHNRLVVQNTLYGSPLLAPEDDRGGSKTDPVRIMNGTRLTESPWGFLRRGVIWWDRIPKLDEADYSEDGKDSPDVNFINGFNDVENHKYGFTFMYNPSEFSVTTEIDSTRTPSVGDMFTGSAIDDFEGFQDIVFSLFIDRTLDMAYISLYSQKMGLTAPSDLRMELVPDALVGNYIFERTTKIDTGGGKVTKQEKIADIAKRGTLHDIDYLYKTINGGNFNRFGMGDATTGDLGYLSYSLLNLSIGPNIYSGVIRSMSVKHTMFTESMVPIHTTLDIAIQLRATARPTSVGGATKSGLNSNAIITPTGIIRPGGGL